MIDILIFEIPLILFLVFLLSKTLKLKIFFCGMMLFFGIFHALSLYSFFSAPVPEFSFVNRLSIAYSAGVRLRGVLESVAELKPNSLGNLVADLSLGQEQKISTNQGVYLLPANPEQSFPWQAFDSYLLEELSGGLVLLPRKPILLARNNPILLQVNDYQQAAGFRIAQAAGRKVNLVTDFLDALKGIPNNGVALIRLMRPSPDDGVSSMVFSPIINLVPADGAQEKMEEKLTRIFGFSGFFFLVDPMDGDVIYGTPEHINNRPILGARHMLRLFQEEKKMRKISVRLKDGGSFMWYGKDSRSIWVRPRLALAPWVGSGFFTSFLMGFPFAPIRQFLGLLQLPLLYKYWHSIPKQFYSLDDAAEKIPAFFFFRLSSIFLSFAIVTLVWGAAFRLVSQFARSSNFRYRNVFVFGLVMIFQIGDIFVIHFSR